VTIVVAEGDQASLLLQYPFVRLLSMGHKVLLQSTHTGIWRTAVVTATLVRKWHSLAEGQEIRRCRRHR